MQQSLGSITSTVRPSTPRVSVTQLSVSGQINPTPTVYEDSERLLELYLSPDKLKDLTGMEDLMQVATLEMCVDTRENTLGNLGSYLPNLVHLKVNNSLVTSVRDLGTTLSHLQALWMARCGLPDLDGIPSFTCLKELYVAYNHISDLSQVSMLEQLQVLDLEGNSVDDLIQVQYLGLCCQLTDLTLEGNPVCTQTEPYGYRSAVRELIPQLRYLDNEAAGDTEPRSRSTTTEDLLKESIKDSAPTGEEESASVPAPTRPSSAQQPVATIPALCSLSRPSSTRPISSASSLTVSSHPGSSLSSRPGSSPSSRPGSSLSSRPGSSPSSRPGSSLSSRPGSSPSSRPGSSRPCSSRPCSADLDLALLDQDASGLTHGVGRVICGNPVQALRAHRQKMGNPASVSHPPSSAPPRHMPEHTFDLEESGGKDRRDVFSELRAWRKEHSKRLQAIEQERQPQVMKISHSDEDEEGEEEGMGHSLSFTSDEEEEEEGGRPVCVRLISTASPDSSFNSPPPDLLDEREALSPEISRLSLSPTPPPALIAPPSGQSRRSGVRARRLWLKAESGTLALEERRGEGVPRIRRALGTPRGVSHRPLSSPAVHSQSSEAGKSCQQPIGMQPVIRSSTAMPPLTRPLTARAVLQRLPNHMEQSPGPGPSH